MGEVLRGSGINFPEGMSPAEKERMATLLAQAAERGRENVEYFKSRGPDDQLNMLAATFYHLGPGGEMGSFDFDELPEIDYERHTFVDKSTYRRMAWTALSLFGADDAQLMNPRRWEWKTSRELNLEAVTTGRPYHELMQSYSREDWEVAGPGLRRRKFNELEQLAATAVNDHMEGKGKVKDAVEQTDGSVKVDVISFAILGATYKGFTYRNGKLEEIKDVW